MAIHLEVDLHDLVAANCNMSETSSMKNEKQNEVLTMRDTMMKESKKRKI